MVLAVAVLLACTIPAGPAALAVEPGAPLPTVLPGSTLPSSAGLAPSLHPPRVPLPPRSDAQRATARRLRREAIESVRHIQLRADLPPAHHAELTDRLAALYLEDGVDRRLSDPPGPEATHAFEAAVRLVASLEDRHPTYVRLDRALLVQAHALHFLGRRDDALRRYEHLVRAFPHSPARSDAALSIGESLFHTAPLEAHGAYTVAAADPTSSSYAFALYKRAWLDLQGGAPTAAIDALLRVVHHTRHTGRHPELEAVALEDLVTFYRRSGRLDEGRTQLRALRRPELAAQL